MSSNISTLKCGCGSTSFTGSIMRTIEIDTINDVDCSTDSEELTIVVCRECNKEYYANDEIFLAVANSRKW